MSNRIHVIETRSYRALPLAAQSHLDAALSLVPGARCQRFESLLECLQSDAFSDGVVYLPVLVPSHENDVLLALRTLEKNMPLPCLFGLQIVLWAEQDQFSPDALADPFWIETMDKFYDQAVPVNFTVVYRDAPQVQLFQIASGISGLFRDVDSLKELRRIGNVLADMEERISLLEQVASAGRS